MTSAASAARAISDYLTLGAHHSTPDGQTAMAAIIAQAGAERHAEQAEFFVTSMRCVIADKDRQIARLSASS